MRRRGRAVAQWTLVLSGVGLLVWQLPEVMAEASHLSAELARLQWWWVLVATVLGVGGLVAYGELHRRLLIAGGVRLPVRTVQAINFVENALSTTLPAVGNAAGFVYATYQLHKRKVDVALAAWSLVLAGLVASIVLVLLGVLGAGVTGMIPALAAAALAIGVALGAWASWAVVTRPSLVHRCSLVVARLAHKLPGSRCARRKSWVMDPDAAAERVAVRIGWLHPSARQWLVIAAVAALSWVLDFVSLSASASATGEPVPWSALVIGFLIVQGSIALQIFPGGAGLADAGLLGVLVAASVPVASAMAIVLVYRIINWLGLAGLGWIVYAAQIRLGAASARRTSRYRPPRPAPGPKANRGGSSPFLGLDLSDCGH